MDGREFFLLKTLTLKPEEGVKKGSLPVWSPGV
jgi:hypothetical protein